MAAGDGRDATGRPRGQQDVIACLQEENRVLHEQLGGRRVLFTERQRLCLAAKAKVIGRKGLFEITTLVTPDTLTTGWTRLRFEEGRCPGTPS